MERMADNDELKSDSMFTRISLIGKLKDQNDNKAWSEFTACYRKYIYNIIRRMGLSHHDADEIVQITLVKVWNAMPKFNYSPKKGRFRSWLCSIASNAAKNFVRDNGPTTVSLSSGDFDYENLKEMTIPPEAEELAEREWQLYLPELALKNISGNFDRKTIQAFVLFSQGVPVSEIAKRLNLAESSIYVYKQRVMNKLLPEIERLKKEL